MANNLNFPVVANAVQNKINGYQVTMSSIVNGNHEIGNNILFEFYSYSVQLN